MASCQKTYNADFFKKNDGKPSKTSNKITKFNSKTEVRENLRKRTMETSNSNEELDDAGNFNNEDRQTARLYRQVVDDIMAAYNLKEWQIYGAISSIKEEIHQAHKKGFIRFSGIDFCKPKNRCGYLRRYAICHTGLVKKAIWQFFKKKDPICNCAREVIFNTHKLKVVSLGGGPGNDLVGFCSALQEKLNTVKELKNTETLTNTLRINELDLKIVDISQGWMAVFSSILNKAKSDNFGTISEFLKNMKITTSFIRANLSSDEFFEDETLASALGEADVVLMVKLVSFISDREAEKLVQNVVESMQEGAQLIFIDHPYDENFFNLFPDLKPIYYAHIKYEMSFKPRRYLCPSISSTQAYIGVFKKELANLD